MDLIIKPDNFTSPFLNDEFSQKINTLNEKLPAIIDDFNKYYVFYNKNPEYQEYQQIFENIKGNLQSVNSDLVKISNDIDKNTNTINSELLVLNDKIKKEKQLKILLDKRDGIVQKYNSSNEMIEDYKEIYNLNYTKNCALFIGIIGSVIIYRKTFINQ
jgi:CCR4-NOT transcriptional regulation complex NOT5 subunit